MRFKLLDVHPLLQTTATVYYPGALVRYLMTTYDLVSKNIEHIDGCLDCQAEIVRRHEVSKAAFMRLHYVN